MNEDKTIEISDPQEKKLWDDLMDMIVGTAQQTQKNLFHKYKLAYHLQTHQVAKEKHNSLNTKEALKKQEKYITEITNDFHQDYLNKINEIKTLSEKYKNQPVMGIMLNTTLNNLKKLFTYNELHSPTLNQLKNSVNALYQETPKPNDISPEM